MVEDKLIRNSLEGARWVMVEETLIETVFDQYPIVYPIPSQHYLIQHVCCIENINQDELWLKKEDEDRDC